MKIGWIRNAGAALLAVSLLSTPVRAEPKSYLDLLPSQVLNAVTSDVLIIVDENGNGEVIHTDSGIRFFMNSGLRNDSQPGGRPNALAYDLELFFPSGNLIGGDVV